MSYVSKLQSESSESKSLPRFSVYRAIFAMQSEAPGGDARLPLYSANFLPSHPRMTGIGLSIARNAGRSRAFAISTMQVPEFQIWLRRASEPIKKGDFA